MDFICCYGPQLNPLRRTGKDELLETAMALHDAAIKDEYFVKRKLAPNVDFWYVLLPTFLFHGCSCLLTGGKLIVALCLKE